MRTLVLGFGEMSARRRAHEARRHGSGPICLYGGFSDTDRLPEDAAHVSAGDSGALSAWLESGVGPILVVHDDTKLSRTNLETLAEIHGSTGRTAVAWADDAGMSRHLPPDVAPPVENVPAAQVSCVALVTDPSLIPAIIARGALDPGVQLTTLDAVIAPVAANHVGDCRERARRRAPADDRPLLVASIIVRDESDQIEACIASLDGIVDRVEVCDTGSVDGTPEICRRLGVGLGAHTWTDDFAAARNVALERCRDAVFVLSIDADERLVVGDPERFRSYLASTAGIHRAYAVPMTNLVDGEPTSSFTAFRIFSPAGAEWRNPLHEYPADAASGEPLGGPVLDALRIDHLGYDPAIVEGRGKHARNRRISRAAYEANPTFKTRLDYARSLVWAGGYDDEAYAVFREAAEDMTGASPAAAAYVLAHVAYADFHAADIDAAWRTVREALQRCDGEPVAHLVEAWLLRDEGRDDEVIERFTLRQTQTLAPPMFDVATTRWAITDVVIGAMLRLGEIESAFTLSLETVTNGADRFTHWAAFSDALSDAMRTAVLSQLVQRDPGASWLDALVRRLAPADTARLALVHAESRIDPDPAVVSAGIMAGLVAGDMRTAEALAGIGRTVIDPETRSAIADRCHARGAAPVAELLIARS